MNRKWRLCRLTSLVLTGCLLTGTFFEGTAGAQQPAAGSRSQLQTEKIQNREIQNSNMQNKNLQSEEIQHENVQTGEKDALELYARSAVLMDGSSGRILYGKNPEEPMPMASTTKIMTCILALEYADWENTVCTVSAEAAAQPKVKLGMLQGDTFYLKDLLYSLMLESHNDTAVCIAEAIGGSVEGFAELMNRKAEELGCTDTWYITPNGLDAEDSEGTHHTTAAELARVMKYCVSESSASPQFLQITQADTHTFTNTEGTRTYSCCNHNAFLHMMDGALSGKTGFTSKAGYCYVGALERDGKLLIVSLLACGWPNNKRYKWTDTRRLMEYGLENYELRTIGENLPELPSLLVENGRKSEVTLTADPEPMKMLMQSGEKVTRSVHLAESLTAPVASGTRVGNVEYQVDGVTYLEYPVYTEESSEEIDYQYCLQQLLRKYISFLSWQ